MIALDILSDGFFAAIAGIGFGAISDPPLRAYNMVFSLIMSLQTMNEPERLGKYMETFFANGLVTCTVIFMLAVGATFPMFLFPHKAFSLTRH